MLLDEVLEIGRLETDQPEFHPELLDIDTFCQGLVEEIQIASAQTHELKFTRTGSCRTMFGDKKLLGHIVTNLLTNAVKYSPSGKAVHVHLTCFAESAVLQVRDEGIGIPEADQKHLFEPFHRAGNVGAIKGTGLGLAITKRAVELHGGSIRVESKVGVGTTFTVTIPTTTDAQPDAEYVQNAAMIAM